MVVVPFLAKSRLGEDSKYSSILDGSGNFPDDAMAVGVARREHPHGDGKKEVPLKILSVFLKSTT